MNKRLCLFVFILFSLWVNAEESSAEKMQTNFETRYREFLASDSQGKLPFNELTKSDWKTLTANEHLKIAFQKQDVFYQGKTYVFTLYQSTQGKFYLNAKGGFWGMEELVYGPISSEMLQ